MRRAAFAAASDCATATATATATAWRVPGQPAGGHRRGGVSSKEERCEFLEWIESLREGPIVV
ncbi:hypothetical protein Tamer19_05040 [Cupriavidus sp. TA19]|nr:hypothetical protein Tamer19_05040 [Cupriavidus sp. TA19]